MNKILKSKKAITLISLVVTIVILVILAAVAINMAIGNNGLFNKAKLAKQEYANSSEKEREDIDVLANDVDTIAGTRLDNQSTPRVIDYSKGEQETGEIWITGKKVYTQVIDFGLMPSNTEKSVNHNIANVEDIWIDLSNSYWENRSLSKPRTIYSMVYASYLERIGCDSTQVFMKNTVTQSVYSLNVCLKYTKTTDPVVNS